MYSGYKQQVEYVSSCVNKKHKGCKWDNMKCNYLLLGEYFNLVWVFDFSHNNYVWVFKCLFSKESGMFDYLILNLFKELDRSNF
jgi:hypothetical protein